MRPKPGGGSEEDQGLTCGSKGKSRQCSAWLDQMSENEEGWRVTCRCWNNGYRGPPTKRSRAGYRTGSSEMHSVLDMQSIQVVLGHKSCPCLLGLPISWGCSTSDLCGSALRPGLSCSCRASCGVVRCDLPGSPMLGCSRIWGQDIYLRVTREQRKNQA